MHVRGEGLSTLSFMDVADTTTILLCDRSQVPWLVSCGRENTRFWEIKRGCVKGSPVILNQYARGCEFTDLAYESSFGPKATDMAVQRRVFVSSTAGTLLQVRATRSRATPPLVVILCVCARACVLLSGFLL